MATFYLLFSRFPYDFETPLPLAVGQGTFLDRPGLVNDLLAEDVGLKALLVPHELAGGGGANVCLRCDIDDQCTQQEASLRVFMAWFSMRLVLPLASQSTGIVILREGRLEQPQRLANSGLYRTGLDGFYSAADIGRARVVNDRMSSLHAKNLSRPRSAIILFAHMSIGRVDSWQLTCVGLFAVLECLFPQPVGNKNVSAQAPQVKEKGKKRSERYGERLARRTVTFLTGHLPMKGVKRSISSRYRRYRNPLAHGYHDVGFEQTLRPESAAVVQELNMICRAVILGMLGLSNAELRKLLPVRGGRLVVQDRLEALRRAPGLFLERFVG